RLLDDDLEGGQVPQGDFRIEADLAAAFRDQDMGPEVTEGPRPPTPFGQIQEAVAAADAGPTREARVGDLGVVERRHRADVDGFGVGERALAAGSPPPPAQGGRRGNADGDLAV